LSGLSPFAAVPFAAAPFAIVPIFGFQSLSFSNNYLSPFNPILLFISIILSFPTEEGLAHHTATKVNLGITGLSPEDFGAGSELYSSPDSDNTYDARLGGAAPSKTRNVNDNSRSVSF
jgi:hypothetical protein